MEVHPRVFFNAKGNDNSWVMTAPREETYACREEVNTHWEEIKAQDEGKIAEKASK